MGGFVRGVGLIGMIALCVGNMVGTSVYTLPASLASTTGPLGIVAWIVTAAGYALVAVVYAQLGSRYPRTGGPYVFAREAFGEVAGFATVWSYWLSAVIGNVGIATGVIGYATGFSTTIAGSVLYQFLLAQALLWSLCALNVRGVRETARLQVGIMILVIVPLVLLTAASLSSFDASNLRPFAPHGWSTLAGGAALVVWAYSGVESATVPAEEVSAPQRTIARATIIGYLIATTIFLLIALAVAGALPNDVIASSPRPLALTIERGVGAWGAHVISVAAIIGGIGTLNGWILMAGRIPVSAAKDGIFFPAMGRLHPRRGTPHVALIASTAIASLMLGMYFNRSLLGVFQFIVLLSVLLTLLPHLVSMAAEMVLARRDTARFTEAERRRAMLIGPLAFVFVLYTIYGTGLEAAAWGVAALAAGIPLYLWLKRKRPVTGAG